MAKKTSPARPKTSKKVPAKAADTPKKRPAKKTSKKVSGPSKGTAKKKVATSTAASKAGSKKKAPARKVAGKKTPSKKPAAKKTVKKVAKKKVAKKKVVKKKVATSKPTAKKTSKKTSKKAAPRKAAPKKAAPRKPAPKKPASKKASTRKPANKKVETKKKVTTTPRSATTKAGATKTATSKNKTPDKGGRKGLTVVPDKSRQRPRRSRPKPVVTQRPIGSQLLAPGAPKRAPLIPSGPSAPKAEPQLDLAAKGKIKCPFKKRELDKFRQLLLKKRRTLVGDVSQLEDEALKGNSGNLSHNPSHQAEQGSDSADQSLSLGLAAADRRLINEIDDALKRIDDGKFGICEMTGQPIRAERLQELPWARYTIAAARERERNMSRGNW